MERYYKNHDETLKKRREYWKNNKTKLNAQRKKYREENRGWIGVSKRKWSISLNGRYARYKKAARERNREFLITKEEFDQITKLPCHYCGVKQEFVGVDRKDNSISYVKTNCLPCCKECNFLKGGRSYVEFNELCIRIADNFRKNNA